jgi:hypothetical protein
MVTKYGKSLDINDFCHENSPYKPGYERPLNLATPELNSDSTPLNEGSVGPSGKERQEFCPDIGA